MSERQDTPKPGSPEAITAGCKCPVIDNGHGLGYLGQAGVYVYNEDCPLHLWRDWFEEDSEWRSRLR